MIVFVYESADGVVLPTRIPGDPSGSERCRAALSIEIQRRKAAKISLRGVFRRATEKEIQQWNIQVPT